MQQLISLLRPGRLKITFLFILIAHLMCLSAWSQLPTATQVASQMKVGWNIGNTLEAPCGETCWGNPMVTQQLINSVKAAGFNTVRIPCAWDSHVNQGTIDAAWLARVKQVVDYCINNNMYVILNIHWDGGWLENNVTTSAQASVNAKQTNYWTQIANYFKGYNERLLFAGANEPNVEDATGMSVLLSYHQTFINAVRATGGNNSSRTLIIQGPSTDIEKTNNLMNTMPTDQIANRLIVEIHYYTPYQFCLMTSDASWGNMFYYWGNGYHSTTDITRNATWGEEADVERYFGLMKSKFVDRGIPVVIGEFVAIKRPNLTGSDMSLHLASREYYHKYIVNSATKKGMIPVYWDTGDYGSGLFNRNTGAVTDQGLVNAIMQSQYTIAATTSGTGSVSLSPSGGTYNPGTVVTVTATAGSGWQFSGWSGDLTGTTNPASITMSSNKTLVANFTQTQTTQYTLTVNITGQGTVSPNGGSYASGTSLTLAANAATGYHFVSWSGAATGSANPVTVLMNTNKTVTALFEVNQAGGCANPVAISIPFVQNGAGNFCWVTSTPMAYINSWNLNSLKINEVNFTNIYSSNLPPAQNGQWFIEYSGSFAWSHFEAPQSKSATRDIEERGSDIILYPNPFTENSNLIVDNSEQVNRIVIIDVLGREIERIERADVKKFHTIGASLKAGTYIMHIYGSDKLQSIKMMKNP